MLEIKNLSLAFGGTRALDDVSLTAESGRITGLIGPNGSGKTTCLNVVSGVYRADSGAVLLDGTELPAGDPARIARAGVGRTFQVPRLATRLTVLDNLVVAAQRHPGERYLGLLRPWTWRRVEAELREQAVGILDRFSLADKATTLAGALSGGQMKLLSLGMALMADRRVLLLDEPAAGVNAVNVERLMVLLDELRAEGRTMLIIEHNMDLVTRLCDTIHVLDAGRLVASGVPTEIQENPEVIEAYLGGAPVERDAPPLGVGPQQDGGAR